MKKLIVAFLITLIANISSAQSGWGYVNYTSYKTHNGTGVTNQYQAHPNSAAEFDILLNTSNSNTTITHTGEVTLATMCDGSTGTPHWGSDFYAIKFEFWFIPTQTGSYSFGVNSDDASDLSVDGTVITTYYGGHGAGGYQYGSKNMVAGTRYKIITEGTSNFTTFGSPYNDVGTIFTANATGSGTGTVQVTTTFESGVGTIAEVA